MYKNGLILTLGHGSSATLILDNQIVNGYQTERITGVKGDSRFPSFAIEEIEKWDDIPDDITIYISHWEPAGDVFKLKPRHFNYEYLAQRFPKSSVISTNPDITHHDTHAFSALAYNSNMAPGTHVCVADGFGTWGEVMSFYERTDHGLTLIKRVFGYDQSLGLLYQYATDYVGLKQNQDEWKLNAMATSCRPDRVETVRDVAYRDAHALINAQRMNIAGKPDDPVINIGALSHTHGFVVETLQAHFAPDDKAEIALYLQTIVERVLTYWINELNIEHLTVVGGCFLNVQLNGFLQSQVSSFCAMPLSGDEGAGFGLFKKFNSGFTIPNDLCFGKRHFPDLIYTPGLVYIDECNLDVFVRNALKDNQIVNVVRGSMEYGPRAYCNTSTLALPTEENKQYINMLNDRAATMPMCPVLTVEDFRKLFDTDSTIYRSIEHMIVALPLLSHEVNDSNKGITHTLLDGTVTGRPQVIYRGHWAYSICEELGPLINTSFNNHGSPICFDLCSVVRCHECMYDRDIESKVITFVVSNDRSELPQAVQKLSVG